MKPSSNKGRTAAYHGHTLRSTDPQCSRVCRHLFDAPTVEDMVSYNQSAQWQRLAALHRVQFEAALPCPLDAETGQADWVLTQRNRIATACELGLEKIVAERAGNLYRSATSRSRLKSNNQVL